MSDETAAEAQQQAETEGQTGPPPDPDELGIVDQQAAAIRSAEGAEVGDGSRSDAGGDSDPSERPDRGDP